MPERPQPGEIDGEVVVPAGAMDGTQTPREPDADVRVQQEQTSAALRSAEYRKGGGDRTTTGQGSEVLCRHA
ncbi:hypothetical protein ACGF3G_43165 [Streptomyces sp. NPDC048179]|uniref:hypothetical protein n=1 Tax=Streptomyces sp. NPDC048179 TaxID=3365506 RepID=UPI0037156C1B